MNIQDWIGPQMKRVSLWVLAFSAVAIIVVGFTTDVGHLFRADDDHAKPIKAAGTERDQEHQAHGNEGEEKGHEGENKAAEIRLTEAQVKLAGIQSVDTKLGRIDLAIQLTGEVRVNQDRAVQVVPRVPGAVRSVRSFLGDNVVKGTVMAVLDSREFADAKSSHIASRERTRLARSKFEREDRLWRKRISSEQEYLNARSVLAEARIAERAAAQKLRALGLSSKDLKNRPDSAEGSLTRFEVLAPFNGTIIEKHITAGASVDETKPIFRIADLRTVWVIASVYEKDIARVRKGQTASVITKAYPDRTFEGRITWVADTLDEQTRTLKVRIEVDNQGRQLKPGMFVQVGAIVGTRESVLTVPAEAIRRQGGEVIVFIDEGGGQFERREIVLGVQSSRGVEVRSGLKPGERVVTAGSFILKSELEKEGFGGGHGH